MTPKSQFKEMKRIGMTEQELENLLVKYAIESEKAHLSQGGRKERDTVRSKIKTLTRTELCLVCNLVTLFTEYSLDEEQFSRASSSAPP
jgi:hypothetical protein